MASDIDSSQMELLSEDTDQIGTQAPSWPFDGIINSRRTSLQFWDVNSGALNEVSLGTAAQWDCYFDPLVAEDHVEIRILGGYITYLVPWGDLAYPSFVPSETEFVRSSLQQLPNGQELEVMYTPSELLRVRVGESVGYYEVLSNELVRIDRHIAEQRQSTMAEDDLMAWVPLAFVSGTDGYHYGFRILFREPACPAEMGFVVAIDTGEIVACGSIPMGGLGGPVLVSADGSDYTLDRAALPDPGNSAPCVSYLDLNELSLPSVKEEQPE